MILQGENVMQQGIEIRIRNNQWIIYINLLGY